MEGNVYDSKRDESADPRVPVVSSAYGVATGGGAAVSAKIVVGMLAEVSEGAVETPEMRSVMD